MYLSRAKVSGLRASAEGEIECQVPGRFSVLIGANGAGKTTITDSLYLAHTASFRVIVCHRATSVFVSTSNARSSRVA